MTHILIINEGKDLSSCIREISNTSDLRCVIKESPVEARLVVERNVFALAIIYNQSPSGQLSQNLQILREMNLELPVLVINSELSEAVERVAFEGGCDLYLVEPVSAKTLLRIVRLYVPDEIRMNSAVGTAVNEPLSRAATRSPVSALQILRDFSHVLGFSLDYMAFTHHFIMKLRDQISFSRIGIFLETDRNTSFSEKRSSNALKCIASFGLPSDLVDCFQLSRDMGIGKVIMDDSRILSACTRAETDALNPAIRKELAILGCQIAIPISDREGPIGVAILSGPVTGRQYDEEELQLLYLLMEELGLAIRNSRLHAEVAANEKLIGHVLRSMVSGALVFNESMQLLYTNASAETFLGRLPGSKDPIVWADLPPLMADPIHRAIEKGELSDPFFLPSVEKQSIHRITIIPFSQQDELKLLPQPVMVIIEDFTKIEANKLTAMADTRSELISLIAERFAHEIRNALVPLMTHMQLFDRKIEQVDFQISLKAALERETHRIKRFSEQMLYLAQNSNPLAQRVCAQTAIEEGFLAAKTTLRLGHTKLRIKGEIEEKIYVDGNPEGLKYAFEEIFYNSLQSSTEFESIDALLSINCDGNLQVCIRDTGPGFSDEAIRRAVEPFYTSRSTGVGLGLSVAKKIFEEHHGRITLNSRKNPDSWDLRIELPTV